ncbi:glycosyltransferase family 1 protein [Amylostereum chailletii]|nr:glycosyltransferase family 1 protein [Amylostereum chailletii]
MRAGTQTLIQVLQALPWAQDADNEDEIPHNPLNVTDADSDDDDVREGPSLASSIHTIHRPVARSRRQLSGSRLSPISSRSIVQDDVFGDNEDITPKGTMTSDEEIEEGDFELPTPGTFSATAQKQRTDVHSPLPPVFERSEIRKHSERTASLATVKTIKISRRARLAEKLAEVFEVNGINEVIAEIPCWLMRSVLLQGYMFLTNSYLCFFAHMPAREDQVLKSGSIYKKTQRTKRWIKHWFVLKNDVLSWYQSSSDPYFPHGVVDLRYAISCDPVNEKGIRLRTNSKTVQLSADSVPSRDEWVKAIRKVMFKAQNMGDSIAIPYSTIIDVDMSTAMDFTEALEVKVVDGSEDLSVDSYFFAYFHDPPAALEQIRDAVSAARRFIPDTGLPFEQLIDTTAPRSAPHPDRTQSAPDVLPKTSMPFRLSSLLRPFQDAVPRTTSTAEGLDDNEGFTHVQKRDNSSFIPIASLPTSPADLPHLTTPSASAGSDDLVQSPISLTPTPTGHTYPPSTSPTPLGGSFTGEIREAPSTSNWMPVPSVPSWLRMPRRVFGGPPDSASTSRHAVTLPPDGKHITEIYSSVDLSSTSRSGHAPELGFSVLETPEAAVDLETAEKFQSSFAFDDREKLLGYFPGYLFRMLPVYGRLYVSHNYLCFKSSGPLTSKTRMIIPLRDILSTESSKSFRFGHYGLIIIVKGHEELFLEFGQQDRREAFVNLVDKQLEDVQRRMLNGDPGATSPGKRDALILEEFGQPSSDDTDPAPPPENMTDSLPAVMFTSTSSTFLTFKPEKSLRFTFLTIGSRGDVQPYIALAKGLMADGHRVKIATHGEFQQWIESYGIEFGYVGGDPAELMRICVENGTFTVAFLREGIQKFRGWIDDLLKTSWEACQDTDVLVESPSAMAGYHIAEALRIPYFRAFTMTWSRTRAYPHAFAVPERKMGGGYNYMTYVMFDQIFWRGTSGQINRWRRNTLGLSGTSLDKMEPHKIPFLYNFSPTVVPAPLDWPEWIRITGYWFLDDADVSGTKWAPPPELVNFIGDARKANKKIVYIGFGSIVVSDPKSMTRAVIDAVVQSGVHAILSKGWSDRLAKNTAELSEPEEPLPKQIYSISSVPHDWLFKQIDAACHHGGAGTTGASLRAGIPTIIKPFFGDQFFWGDRVEALGIGSCVRKLTVETLSEALVQATTDPKQIDRARLVGEQIRQENGVTTAIEALYRDLEYARTLIRRAADEDEEGEDATIRGRVPTSVSAISTRHPSSHPTDSPAGGGAPSEDWSVISDPDDLQLSMASSGSSPGSRKPSLSKRNSLTSAVLSVLPDALTSSHRRSRSTSSISAT